LSFRGIDIVKKVAGFVYLLNSGGSYQKILVEAISLFF